MRADADGGVEGWKKGRMEGRYGLAGRDGLPRGAGQISENRGTACRRAVVRVQNPITEGRHPGEGAALESNSDRLNRRLTG